MLGKEPVLWTTFIRSGILAFVLFGANLSELQIGGIMAFVEAGIALFARSQVSPS